jgi:PHD/YefM family antitoxin component YafN of YafNO toxin-antitoxin module
VEGRAEEIVITRNGRAAAVLVSPGDLESLKETVAVRSDTALAAEIRRGLAALKRGKAKLYTLDALFDE